MAPTPQGPQSPRTSGEHDALSIALDAGLYGPESTERYARLRDSLGGEGGKVDRASLEKICQQFKEGEINLTQALKAYGDVTDSRQWPVLAIRPNIEQEKLEDRLLTLGFEIVPPLASAYRRVGLIPVRVPPEPPIVEAISKRPDVSRVERSWQATTEASTAPDPKGLLTYPDELINAEELDKELFGTRDPVIIGLLDSGIDARHPVLQTRLLDQRAFRYGEERIGDRFGHGTAVAGIITKLCPSAHFYSAKVLDEGGRGNLDDLIRAVAWLHRKRPDIVVCSALTEGLDDNNSIASGLFDELAACGIPVFIPTRDPEGNLAPPADAKGVISVGMATKAGISTKATLLARGTQLRVPRSIQANKKRFPMLQPTGWTTFESPASATAFAAGIACLLMRAARMHQRRPTASDILEALMDGADARRHTLDPTVTLQRFIKKLQSAPPEQAQPTTARINAQAEAQQDVRPPAQRTKTPSAPLKAPPVRTKTPTDTPSEETAVNLEAMNSASMDALDHDDEGAFVEEIPTLAFAAHHAPAGQGTTGAPLDPWDEVQEEGDEPTMAMDEGWTLAPEPKKK